MTRWAILTGEYPPQPGGVADYTALVAGGLAAAGDEVTVCAPRFTGTSEPTPGVEVVRLPDHFGPRGLATLDDALARPCPDRILIQYVPHAYGYKAMNLPFAAWVAARGRRIAPVWVMFHEVAFPIDWRPAHALVGGITRGMARLVAGAADRVFVSVPAWGELVRSICPHARTAEWLPVPSNVPAEPNVPPADLAARFRFPVRSPVVGHFGTFGGPVTRLFGPALAAALETDATRVAVLVGWGGDAYRDAFAAAYPTLGGRVYASGAEEREQIPGILRGCTVLLQPYIDGISSRRTSAMAGLANGVPLATNPGAQTEPLWSSAGGVRLAADSSPAALAAAAEAVLIMPPTERATAGRAAAELYRERFSLEHTVARLRGGR